ncbi:EscU/YscU/HrcU family type III secretion system export apparatus switch protein [Treponema pectinovorum]|uniref:EscU/YscU/HrcU family type III secretion system export apparatus switch protein n=1 Tax=Treponema pectinovorum TaxID=164 RepID=UPI0011CAB919|nr:EscU/YscU/HrcU family type III secretion system export apparatus switch protein [Treponema pectinovorum]
MDFSQIDLQWFAAEDEGRTEEASELKIQRAREEGRVAKSQELNSALVMLVCVIVLIIAAPFYLRWCEQVLVYYFSQCAIADFTQKRFLVIFFINLTKMLLPPALAGGVAAFAGNLIQNRGFIFSTKPIEFKISVIIPRIGQYLKKTIFSPEGAFNVVKQFVKVFAVILIAFIIIKANTGDILALLKVGSVRLAAGRVSNAAAQILAFCSIVFLALSIPDYFVQRYQFLQSLKMTKQEVKIEFKEQEGDPEVKGKLQQAQRALLQQNLPRAVAESDVVVTNPTHFSVALKYDSQKADRPIVNAKGQDELARRIRELADENGIPRVENVPLARGLYSQVEVGDIIPDEFIKAIAVVYTQIDYLGRKK